MNWTVDSELWAGRDLNTNINMEPSDDRQLWPQRREAEWAIGGAMFGMAAAAIQLLSSLALEKSRKRINLERRNSGRSWRTEKMRNNHIFNENYIEKWDRSPLVVMDDG